MENPGECSVCYTTYDETEHRPRTLPCGHTYCSLCVGDLMEDDHLSCPTCRDNHFAYSVAQFPVCYAIEAFVKQFETMKLAQIAPTQDISGGTPAATEAPPASDVTNTTTGAKFQKATSFSRKLQSLLKEQKSSLSSVVANSQVVQSQLDKYRAEVADWKTQHLHLLDQLSDLVEQNNSMLELLDLEDTRVIRMKEEGEKQLDALLGCLNTVSTPQEIVTDIEHADNCTVEAEDWMQKCQELFPNVNTLTTSMKLRENTRTVLDRVTAVFDGQEDAIQLMDPASSILKKVEDLKIILKLLNVDDLCRMRPPVKKLVEAGRLFGVQGDQGGLRSSKITLENDKLYLHCLLNEPPPPHAQTIPVGEVVEAQDPSSTQVFLDLCWPGLTRGRVHIRLSPNTSLARQFVLLCTGQRGHSYLNTDLLEVIYKGQPGEYVLCGDYEDNTGDGGAPLLPHPNHQYRFSGRAGTVHSRYGPASDQSALFLITTTDHENDGGYLYVIGEVESGLEVVRAAVNRGSVEEVKVVDCGVVVSL